MNKYFFYILLIINALHPALAKAQVSTTLTLDTCLALARRNYPLVQQLQLIEKTTEYTLDNASKRLLPQVSLLGQATYQSEVTGLPIAVPNVTPLSKDQYKIYAEITQAITDANLIKKQKEVIKAKSAVESEQLEVELYKLRDRVQQLYFGILMLDAQIKQVQLLQQDIDKGLEKTNAAIANGVALKSNAYQLQAEKLKAEQRIVEARATRKGMLDMLALLVGQPLEGVALLQIPTSTALAEQLNRRELKLFEAQKHSIGLQSKVLDAGNLPRLGLFAQAGWGRPALNFLSNDLEAYYIGGLRMQWNLSNYYTAKKEKALLSLQQNAVEVQKSTFLMNMNLTLQQQQNEVKKYEDLLKTDDEIIALREKIKQTAQYQLENGTLTTIDYLAYLNAEDQAKQNKILHQVQLLLAQYNYQNTTGN